MKTSLSITKVPPCDGFWDDCNEDALNLVFVRRFNEVADKEDSQLLRISPDGRELPLSRLPWGLEPEGNIWPEEWDHDPNSARPGVFWPEKYESIFIVFSGKKEMATILHNKITTDLWWENLKEQKITLNPDVYFVGLFHMNGAVYGVGHKRSDGDIISKMFLMTLSKEGHFFLNRLVKIILNFYLYQKINLYK